MLKGVTWTLKSNREEMKTQEGRAGGYPHRCEVFPGLQAPRVKQPRVSTPLLPIPSQVVCLSSLGEQACFGVLGWWGYMRGE